MKFIRCHYARIDVSPSISGIVKETHNLPAVGGAVLLFRRFGVLSVWWNNITGLQVRAGHRLGPWVEGGRCC